MNPILQKLNLKEGAAVFIRNVPPDLQPLVDDFKAVTTVYDAILDENVEFSLIFATKQQEIDAIVPLLAEKAKGDALVWFAYPKGSSKRYQCDFNRDTGWAVLGRFGFEPVRQVAIDDDWSALRFRRVEYIKNRKRDEKHMLTKSRSDGV